ncbi:MAG: hypothetical protein IJ705_04410 [Oscillospiraceae bacterium]|nr:hypothetical protein [Oscillospiraceae bacterium]
MAELLKGAPVSGLKSRGVTPTLAILRVGRREADIVTAAVLVSHAAERGLEAP